MATQVTLKAGRREGGGKGAARKLRASGQIPAVVYGANADPVSVSLDAHATGLLFRSISIENTIVNLEVEGVKVPVPTLVREVQTHAIRPDILHVDFLRIQTGVSVELEVPLHLTGTPKGVREDHGLLEQTVHSLPIRCVPAKIPEEIAVDVTELRLGESLQVSHLTLPDGVEVLLDADHTLCSIQVPRGIEKAAEEEAGEPGTETAGSAEG